MALDKSAVAHIAHLARIKVPEDQLDKLAGELSNILGWIEQLGEVDTDDIAPMTSAVDMRLPWRQDAVDDGDCAEDVTSNAPEGQKGFYTVPKVVE